MNNARFIFLWNEISTSSSRVFWWCSEKEYSSRQKTAEVREDVVGSLVSCIARSRRGTKSRDGDVFQGRLASQIAKWALNLGWVLSFVFTLRFQTRLVVGLKRHWSRNCPRPEDYWNTRKTVLTRPRDNNAKINLFFCGYFNIYISN